MTAPVRTGYVAGMHAPDTPARQALAAWLHDRRLSLAYLADTLNLSHTTVSRWISMSSRPTHDQRAKIEALTAIPASDWDTEEERRDIAAQLAALRNIAAQECR